MLYDYGTKLEQSLMAHLFEKQYDLFEKDYDEKEACFSGIAYYLRISLGRNPYFLENALEKELRLS